MRADSRATRLGKKLADVEAISWLVVEADWRDTERHPGGVRGFGAPAWTPAVVGVLDAVRTPTLARTRSRPTGRLQLQGDGQLRSEERLVRATSWWAPFGTTR